MFAHFLNCSEVENVHVFYFWHKFNFLLRFFLSLEFFNSFHIFLTVCDLKKQIFQKNVQNSNSFSHDMIFFLPIFKNCVTNNVFGIS